MAQASGWGDWVAVTTMVPRGSHTVAECVFYFESHVVRLLPVGLKGPDGGGGLCFSCPCPPPPCPAQ